MLNLVPKIVFFKEMDGGSSSSISVSAAKMLVIHFPPFHHRIPNLRATSESREYAQMVPCTIILMVHRMPKFI